MPLQMTPLDSSRLSKKLGAINFNGQRTQVSESPTGKPYYFPGITIGDVFDLVLIRLCFLNDILGLDESKMRSGKSLWLLLSASANLPNSFASHRTMRPPVATREYLLN